MPYINDVLLYTIYVPLRGALFSSCVCTHVLLHMRRYIIISCWCAYVHRHG